MGKDEVTDDAPDVDWRPFDGADKPTVRCECGAVYHSHVKGVLMHKIVATVSREPCPACSRRVANARSVVFPRDLL